MFVHFKFRVNVLVVPRLVLFLFLFFVSTGFRPRGLLQPSKVGMLSDSKCCLVGTAVKLFTFLNFSTDFQIIEK